MNSKEDIKKTVIHFQMVKKNVSFLLSNESNVYNVVSVVFSYNAEMQKKVLNGEVTFKEWLKNANYKIVRFIFDTQISEDSRVKIIEEKEFEDKIDSVIDFLYGLGINPNKMCNSFHA